MRRRQRKVLFVSCCTQRDHPVATGPNLQYMENHCFFYYKDVELPLHQCQSDVRGVCEYAGQVLVSSFGRSASLVISLLGIINGDRYIENNSFGSLETLALHLTPDVQVFSSTLSSITTFEDAPALCRIILPASEPGEGMGPRSTLVPINFPWHQLTHFESGHSFRMVEAVVQLRSCPNLIECRMTIAGSVLEELGVTSIPLPQLRLFHLKTRLNLPNFFAGLHLPALHEFKFKWLAIGAPCWPQAEISRMIHQSGCSIERLSIHNIFAPPGDFIETLLLMPDLRELELIQQADWTWHTVHRYLNEDGLSSLTDRGQSPQELLVPKLQVFKMDGDFLIEDSLLVDLVQSRWELGIENGGTKLSARLEEVQIPVRNSELDGPLTERLTKMQEEGLKVKIVPYEPVIMPNVPYT